MREKKGFEALETIREQAAEFSKLLEDAGYEAPIRVARGQDILAACGQLKSKKSLD